MSFGLSFARPLLASGLLRGDASASTQPATIPVLFDVLDTSTGGSPLSGESTVAVVLGQLQLPAVSGRRVFNDWYLGSVVL